MVEAVSIASAHGQCAECGGGIRVRVRAIPVVFTGHQALFPSGNGGFQKEKPAKSMSPATESLAIIKRKMLAAAVQPSLGVGERAFVSRPIAERSSVSRLAIKKQLPDPFRFQIDLERNFRTNWQRTQ